MNNRVRATNVAKTRPTADAEMSSPRACLAFGALGLFARIRTSLRDLFRIWNERRNLGADDIRVARTRAQQRGLGATSRSDAKHGTAIEIQQEDTNVATG